jgi:hypothetical protein
MGAPSYGASHPKIDPIPKPRDPFDRASDRTVFHRLIFNHGWTRMNTDKMPVEAFFPRIVYFQRLGRMANAKIPLSAALDGSIVG